MQQLSLIGVRIVFFSAAVAFHLITLPVKVDASKRARNLMVSEEILFNDDEHGVKKSLNRAALTYVVGALATLFGLIKFIIFSPRKLGRRIINRYGVLFIVLYDL